MNVLKIRSALIQETNSPLVASLRRKLFTAWCGYIYFRCRYHMNVIFNMDFIELLNKHLFPFWKMDVIELLVNLF